MYGRLTDDRVEQLELRLGQHLQLRVHPQAVEAYLAFLYLFSGAPQYVLLTPPESKVKKNRPTVESKMVTLPGHSAE